MHLSVRDIDTCGVVIWLCGAVRDFIRDVRSFVVPRSALPSISRRATRGYITLVIASISRKPTAFHITRTECAYHDGNAVYITLAIASISRNQRLSISRATKLRYRRSQARYSVASLLTRTATPSISLHRRWTKGVSNAQNLPRACDRICSRNNRTVFKNKGVSRIY